MRKKRTLKGAAIVAAVCLCIGCEQPLNDAKPVITITTQPAAATVVKQGEITGSLSVAASVTENAALSYQWYSNITNSTTGGTAVSGATSTDFTIPTDLGVETYYYFCEVSADGADSVRSGVALVTVIDSSAGTGITITTQPKAATTVIQGSITGSLSVAASVDGGGTPSYQWYSTTSDSTTDGTAVSGATNATFTIPTDLGLGTHYYYCEVTAEGADSVFSSIAKVTVSDGSDVTVITITTQPAAATTVIQYGSMEVLSVAANVSDGGTPSYQWYSNTTDSTTGGTPVDGETSADFTISTDLDLGTHYYYCGVSADGAAVVYSGVAVVTVIDRSVYIYFSTQPEVETIITKGNNSTESLSVVLYVDDGGTPSYQWYSNDENDNTGGTAIPEATSATFTIPTDLALGTHYYYCEGSADGAEAAYSSVATVIVQSVIEITTQPAEETNVILDSITESLSVVASVSGDGTPSYQWYSSDSPVGEMETTLIEGATSATLTIPNDLSIGTYYYLCEVSADGAASIRSGVATVTVYSVITITTHPEAEITVIEGKIAGSLSVAANDSGDGTFSYQWYSNTTNSTTGGTPVDGETSADFTIPTDLDLGTHYYYCEVDSSTAWESAYSNVTTITVTAEVNTEFVIQLGAITEADVIKQTAYAAANTDAAFSISKTDYATYQWYLNGVTVDADTTTPSKYTFKQEKAGAYELAVVVTDSAGRKYSGSCRVTVR